MLSSYITHREFYSSAVDDLVCIEVWRDADDRVCSIDKTPKIFTNQTKCVGIHKKIIGFNRSSHK